MSFALKFHLKKGDSADERATVVELEPGESLQIECSADESYSSQSFLFLRDSKDLHMNGASVQKSDRKVKLSVSSFSEEHTGDYMCSASSSDSMETVERTIVVRKRDKLEPLHYARKCAGLPDFCQNGGQCYVPLVGDRTPFCMCPEFFAGPHCDSRAFSLTTIQGTKATFGVGGLCTVFLILATILFAVLYRREKRRRRELEEKMNGMMPKHMYPGDTLKVAAEMSLLSAEYVDSVKTPDEESSSPTARSFDPPNLPFVSIEFDDDILDNGRPQSDRPRRSNAVQLRDRLLEPVSRSEPPSRISPC